MKIKFEFVLVKLVKLKKDLLRKI